VGRGRKMQGENLRYIIGIYVNITVHLSVQLLYANINKNNYNYITTLKNRKYKNKI
jgi:hypothetical protein